jgi:hypothetical protein
VAPIGRADGGAMVSVDRKVALATKVQKEKIAMGLVMTFADTVYCKLA